MIGNLHQELLRMPKVNLSKFLESLNSAVLVLVGISGIALAVLHFLHVDLERFGIGHEPLGLILAALGLLMLAVGLERLVFSRRYDRFASLTRKDLAELRKEVLSRGGCIHLKGRREVYAMSERLAREANSRIQSFITGQGVKASREWAQAITKRLRDSKKAGTPVKFDTIIAIDFNKVPPGFQEKVDKRRAYYTGEEVGELSSLALLDMSPPLAFDVLVVDRRHASIAFPAHEGADDVDHSVIFYDQPDLANAFSDWIEERIKSRAIPYDEWVSRRSKL
jgi:hypothetical protein